jgi:hypothetical protein
MSLTSDASADNMMCRMSSPKQGLSFAKLMVARSPRSGVSAVELIQYWGCES